MRVRRRLVSNVRPKPKQNIILTEEASLTQSTDIIIILVKLFDIAVFYHVKVFKFIFSADDVVCLINYQFQLYS